MKGFFDTSVLVPVFYGDHVHHQVSLALFIEFDKSTGCCGAHSLAEVYSTLTRMPGKHRVEIHFLQNNIAVRDGPAGNDLQILHLVQRIFAAVRLDQPDHDIDALLPHQVGILEHLEGLAHAGRRADIDAQLRQFWSGGYDVDRDFCHVPCENESIR